MPPIGVLASWQDARASCIDKGGDLVSILDIGENDFLEALVNQAGKIIYTPTYYTFIQELWSPWFIMKHGFWLF